MLRYMLPRRGEFKEEMEEDRKRAFKQWGEIANKMGTLAENIVAPGVREIARKCFGCNEPQMNTDKHG